MIDQQTSFVLQPQFVWLAGVFSHTHTWLVSPRIETYRYKFKCIFPYVL